MNARELYDEIMVDTNATSILFSENLLHKISDKLNTKKKTLKSIGLLNSGFNILR